ncbi:MAG TPA: hypothetical protein VHZ03_19805 [Trebonia sp.]|nr:hypothetical protein [Trebonia sp.]
MSAGGDGWYGVRCIFRLAVSGPYEERIAIWRARSFGHAVELAELDAHEYAESRGDEYLGFCDSYYVDDDIFEFDNEVFSSLRRSDLSSKEYVRTFFATGREHVRESPPATGGLQWYGVRCVYWWAEWDNQPFEERITLWRTTSLAHAVELAEQEAMRYASDDSGIEYVGFCQGYGPCEGDNVRDGMVVFSLLRDSDLPPDKYIEAFFDTEGEWLPPHEE